MFPAKHHMSVDATPRCNFREYLYDWTRKDYMPGMSVHSMLSVCTSSKLQCSKDSCLFNHQRNHKQCRILASVAIDHSTSSLPVYTIIRSREHDLIQHNGWLLFTLQLLQAFLEAGAPTICWCSVSTKKNADAGPKVGTDTFASPDALWASSIEKEDTRKSLSE
jgi:hypothetical protein